MKTYFLILVTFCLQFPLVAQNQNHYTDILIDFEQIVKRLDFQGSIVIHKEDEIIFQGAYGFSNRESKAPNTIDTRFNYASMGKMFTGVAIMQLVEKGVLDLNDKVIEVWPDYPNKSIAEQITLHQLLTHTSGITGLFQMASESELLDLMDYLPLFVDRELESAPGTRMSYSNAGYILLGLIIEKVTKESYFNYLEKNVLQPAKMNTVGFDLQKVENVATNYTTWMNRGQGMPEIMKYGHDGNSAGGGYATVLDFVNFGKALLKGTLLSPSSWKILTTGYSDGRGRGQYGYGFYVNKEVEDLSMVGHGGGAPGVNGEFQIFENEKLMIAILSNTDPHTSTFLKDAFTGLVMKKTGRMPSPQMNGQVKFELDGYDEAKFVTVQGAFTDGNMFKYPLKRVGNKWVTKIDLPRGQHVYRFIVDGVSIADPNNPNAVPIAGGLVVSEVTVE